jgi:predicted kinase
MARGNLYFTVGLPQSGKSTYCDTWSRHPDVNIDYTPLFELGALKTFQDLHDPIVPRPRVVIAGDDFRKALYGRSYQIEAEATVFAMMDVAARALLNRGFDVIMDETCTTEQTLLRYLRLDRAATAVFINTTKDVCIERAKASGKEYLVGPIERMAGQLDELKKNFGKTVCRLRDYLRSRESQDVSV